MRKLVYESKGLTKAHRIFLIVAPILLLLCGIFFIALSEAKHSGTMMYTSSYSGIIGGGYLLEEEAREAFKTIGIIVCALPILFIYGAIQSNKSYIKVYEDHVEGCQNGLATKQFNLKYSQISHVDPPANTSAITTPQLIIIANNSRYVCMVQGAHRAYQEINSRL